MVTVTHTYCHTHTHCHTHTATLTLRFHDDSVQLFTCLPDIPTGGNLTMTIIAELFKTERVKRATDVYINFDGASDNICYHVFYGLCWLLYSARQAGWPLKRIHILRFKVCIIHAYLHSLAYTRTHITICPLCLLQVGHTHNQLDGTFGLLSRNVYGRQCGGTTARDLLSFSSFKAVCCSCIFFYLKCSI